MGFFSGAKPEFAVVGLGRFGTSVALGLVHDGYRVLGIDRNRELVQGLSDRLSHVAALDATDEEALREVDITSFDTVVVAVGDPFEVNLLTTLQLKRLGVCTVVGRASTELQRIALQHVGADRVVMPEEDAGWWYSGILTSPGVRDYLEVDPDHSVAHLDVPERLVGAALGECGFAEAGLRVLLVHRSGGDDPVLSPDPAHRLAEGESLVVFGSDDSFDRFARRSRQE